MRAALVTGLLVVALVLVGGVGAAGSRSFIDAAGDSGAAPDVVAVDVSNDDAGTLTFALKLANRSALGGDDSVLIAISTDASRYLIYADWGSRTYGLARWNGSSFDFDGPRAESLLTGDGMTFTINRSDLGGAAAFDFFVLTLAGWNGSGYDHRDVAGGSDWRYELHFTPELRSVAPSFTPLRPKAGMRFAVRGARITLGTGETVAAGSITCTAKLAGRALRSTGRCAWTVPATAKGKKLAVTLTVAYGGVKKTAGPFTFTVGGR